jgi:hypothetical protein
MFQDLGSSIKSILNDSDAPADVRSADKSTDTPDSSFSPTGPTVNLFLYDVQENRVLRDPTIHWERVGGEYFRKTPPLRVDCTYLVSAWTDQSGEVGIASEHQLLADTLSWLTRFPEIDSPHLQGPMVQQSFTIPLSIAQDTGQPNLGEFWSALGISPRAAFSLTATVALEIVEPPETAVPAIGFEFSIEFKDVPDDDPESSYSIAGIVRDSTTNLPLAESDVLLVESGRSALTNSDGEFFITGLNPGSFTLRVTSSGVSQDKSVQIPVAAPNEYNVDLMI